MSIFSDVDLSKRSVALEEFWAILYEYDKNGKPLILS